ncbi:atrial natriuretic peptide-converting enzyme-like protein [Dinothrombium tinctorium]|uniref:Atrial natriuretic peptide-converting enzyme-like protein n=1 Tax=Dinothrombium tinctorium TaxID=1965070 RepID=A0A3S3P3X0_9ACAR|nr:atrial natriuretic peptide-converting enzyme-like protein [Dinothrombium tinctorium]RWS11565.1 atrial natriuretic peptide-converting enzyme-like protein [Dinothrombium tinctorium]RWS11602.1 atrial natriuretic peptide-converting enzyme-like protein [Dinothrombium tinctorium]
MASKRLLLENDSENNRALTLWLIALTVLVVISILTICFILVYVMVNDGLDGIYGNKHQPIVGNEKKRSLIARKEPMVIASSNEVISKVKKVRRRRRSPLTSSSSTFVEGSRDPTIFFRRYDDNFDLPKRECQKRSLHMCAGQVPYNSTVYPNYIGDNNELEASRSLPYYNYIAKSRCNRRIKQLLCTFLEPPCADGRPIPPCKKFCRIALEGCAEYVPATLELSAAFDCRRYPDSSDPNVCINLAMGKGCAADEFQCPDKSCIPRHWLCDGVRDCIFAADEANCSGVACSNEEFQCDRKCVPLSWRCDGDRDCLDGSDEQNCHYRPGCGPDRFKCADGFGCIPKRWVCDGKAECRDGSDEVGCTQRECTSGDFKCDNGICIPNIWLCDGQDDCKDNSDERNCNTIAGSSAPLSHSPSSSSSSSSSFSSSFASSSQTPSPSVNSLFYTHQQQNQHQQQAEQFKNHQPIHHQTQYTHSMQQIHSYPQRPSFYSIGPYISHNNIYRWLY